MAGRATNGTGSGGRRSNDRRGRASAAPTRVALIIESSRAFGRGVLEEIAECLRERRWMITYQEGGLSELLPEWLESWEGDGIIARVEDRRIAEALVRKRVPLVDLRGVCPMPGVPVVTTDDAEIARLAAAHLRSCGFRHFAYCGYEGAANSQLRARVFAQFLQDGGLPCHLFKVPEPHLATVRAQEQYGWTHREHLIEWLRGLPKPVGVMACNDARGHQLLNAARELGVRVPDDVAVIGVDNHETVCELTVPPLSSVEHNTRGVAREAVRMLDRMLSGQPPPAAPVLVQPCRVVPRRSTDVLAVPDHNLRQAMQAIRSEPHRRVDEIARISGLSRRDLERRFAAAFGHSPLQEALAVQIQMAKSLLTETDWPLYRVAEAAGYRHAEYFNAAFKRQTGVTPGSYRRQMQRRG